MALWETILWGLRQLCMNQEGEADHSSLQTIFAKISGREEKCLPLEQTSGMRTVRDNKDKASLQNERQARLPKSQVP